MSHKPKTTTQTTTHLHIPNSMSDLDLKKQKKQLVTLFLQSVWQNCLNKVVLFFVRWCSKATYDERFISIYSSVSCSYFWFSHTRNSTNTKVCEEKYLMSVFFCQSDTHSCAAVICRAGSVQGQQSRAEQRGEGGVRRNNQQGNHFQLCSCTAWLACSQLSPERVGSPLLLSSLLSLPSPHTHSL